LTGNRRILRTAALLSLGAFGVHQGRYLLGYGRHADAALAAQGHAYLSAIVVPMLIVALAVALAGVLLRGLTPASQRTEPALRYAALQCAAALLIIYVAQELGEAALVSAHPGGLAGIFGHGGWIAAPLALVAGSLVAFALRAVDAAEGATGLRVIEVRFVFAAAYRQVAAAPAARRGPGMADHLAGRGPPLLCR
jgi:hypothetical protein